MCFEVLFRGDSSKPMVDICFVSHNLQSRRMGYHTFPCLYRNSWIRQLAIKLRQCRLLFRADHRKSIVDIYPVSHM
jgi:hypothetical protein